jgi:hypothetical protein
MSVAFNARMTGGNGTGGNSQQLATPGLAISSTGMTVPAGTTFLAVPLMLQAGATAPSALACTWNGVSMTPACQNYMAAGVGAGAAWFTLVNPTPGNLVLAASWTGNSEAYMGAISFTGTDIVTGYYVGNSVTGIQTAANPSVAINTDANGATVACSQTTATNDVIANQTAIFANNVMNDCAAASYAIGGSGTNSHNFTIAVAVATAWAGIRIIAPSVGRSSLPLMGVGLAPLAWVIRRRQIRAREMRRWARDEKTGLVLPEYKRAS